ncbi:TCR/Tet family MFS transporter [Pedobacter antarcticus]|uniref:TCR/Tet family MFS transporter n=1 Tax=Pedobacter antarcticus TaxID=34086 RepID=UPI001C5708F2|nr:TCR/Tet family MFS transporter [Pedobacter antarcticus]
MAAPKKSAIGFIFITLLIDFTGFGVIIPVLPRLIEEMTGGGLSVAAVYGGWLTLSYSAMQFLSAPVLGGLSDKYGRRPVLLASLFGLGIDYIFLAFAPTIGWLFAGRILAGITGASFTTAMAYIADVSTPEKRAQNFGLIGAAFGIGFIVGPVIGGLFSEYGLRVPFLISAGLSLLNWLYGYFILPESLAPENRRSFDWKRANPVGSLLQVKKYPALGGLLLTLFLLYLASHSVQSGWAYYTMEKFAWTEKAVGYSLGFAGLIVGVVQGGLIRIIIPKIGQVKAVFYGLILYMVGFVLFAFASEGWMMYAFLLPYGLAGIFGPAMQGLISNQVKADSQGEIQGVMAGLMSASAIVGPLIMTNLFAYFSSASSPVYFPGAPFIMAAVLTLTGIFICSSTLKKYHS